MLKPATYAKEQTNHGLVQGLLQGNASVTTLKRILAYSGAVCSAAVFLVGTGMLLLGSASNPRCGDTLCVLLIVVVLIALPVKWAVRYEEYEFKPLMKASSAARKLSRSAILTILAYTAFSQIGSVERGYDFCLGLILLFSWTCLMVYLYGLGMICSERFLAISRHPIFMFRRALLERYLKTKMHDSEVKDPNDVSL